MEKHRIKFLLICSWAFVALSACSSSLKVSQEKKHQIEKNEEFEKTVKIVSEETPVEVTKSEVPTIHSPEKTKAALSSPPTSSSLPVKGTKPPETSGVAVTAGTSPKAGTESSKTSGKGTTSSAAKATETKVSKSSAPVAITPAPKGADTKQIPAQPAKRQPELEDNEGFVGRRPLMDPFRVGEIVTHNVHYFKMSAGELKLKVEPFASVNGLRSYTFATEIKSSSMFSTFYSVDDRAVTHVGYEDLVPRVYSLSVNESGQIREARTFFDHKNLKATFWEKKITKKNGEEERKLEWDTLPFSQNVFSAIFYMRNFAWRDNKEYAFVVSHEKENLVFRGKVVRREKLDTKVGTFDAIVIKPEFTLKGAFKPVGDIFIWLSDDDRRYVLRIESKIRIGTLVSEVIDIQPGRP